MTTAETHTYQLRSNRTTTHIDGMDGVTPDSADGMTYTISACGALTRNVYLDHGKTGDDLSEMLEAARATGRHLCRNCERAAIRIITAAAAEEAPAAAELPAQTPAVQETPARAAAEPVIAEPFTGRHVQSINGGKVHYRSTASDALLGYAFPICRSGGRNQMMTRFRDCDLPVNCTHCMAMHAHHTAHRPTPELAAATPAPVRHVNPDTIAGPRASRNATTEIPVRTIPGPTTPIRVDMRTMSAGVIHAPGWTAQLIRDHRDHVYYALTLDADGEPDKVGRSVHHKEQAIATLARLMGVAGPLSINFQLSNI